MPGAGDHQQMTVAQVDELIAKIGRTSFQQFTNEVSAQDVHLLCNATTNVLQQQQTLVDIQPPVIVCGDIHGQFTDLLRIFTTLGYPSADKKYLFLGDYVDRGVQSLETVMLLFCYKVKYPDTFMLLRGNHECANINKQYGFYEEIQTRFVHADTHSLWNIFNQAFSWMPYVGLIGGKILCMHGGISDSITSLQQLRHLRRPLTEPPKPSLEIDLLWADPKPGSSGCSPNTRGAGVLFGEDVVVKVCAMLDINAIIRAHQFVPSGIAYFADRRLITLFSAPRYNNHHNTGATLTISEDLCHTVHSFPPATV